MENFRRRRWRKAKERACAGSFLLRVIHNQAVRPIDGPLEKDHHPCSLGTNRHERDDLRQAGAGHAAPGGTMTRTTVLVANALPILRAGVQRLLTREGDFDVVEAEDLDELARVAAEHRPAMIGDADLPPEADTIVVAANRFERGL